jgi:hypothetical protein
MRLVFVAALCLAACRQPLPPGVWAQVPISAGGEKVRLNGFAALSADDVWATSSLGVFHFDGKAWKPAGDFAIESLAAVAPDDVWGVGRGGSWFHFDGKGWAAGRVEAPAKAYKDFWGVVAWPGEVWATAGIAGTYSRFDGAGWSEVQVPALARWELQRMTRIGGHVYVALLHGEGEPGRRKFEAAVGHWDGAGWQIIDQPPGYRIRGSAPDDVWIVATGAPRHFDGTSWTQTPIPDEAAVGYDLYARSKTEAWLVGKRGLALKWDGKSWSQLFSGTRSDLYAVSGAAEGPVWAGGIPGVLLRYPK